MMEASSRLPETVRALKGLAEPTRLRLVALLSHGELTVGELCRVLGQSQPRVSRHLRLLTEAGFLDRFREQQCVYYRTPASGARQSWLREVLANINAEDPAIQRDQVRRAVVLADRLRVLSASSPSAPDGSLDAAAPMQEGAGLAAALREELGPGSCGAMLDIGTGSGRMLALLGSQASHAMGIDISAPALRMARARVHGLGLAHCEFHCADMYALPFDAAHFDTVTLDRVLAAAERPTAVLGEALRVLRSSGRLLIVERLADIEACGGGDPRQCLQQWVAASGLQLTRLRCCELPDGQQLIAVAQVAACGSEAFGARVTA
ncbi:MAG: metalloregulator ArsR/SmtB family transcription factor [Steroidobacteraceae bacterium]